MLINTVETAIIERLKAKIPDAYVEAFPDNPALFVPKHPKVNLLCRYADSTYSEPGPTDIIVQERKMAFDITIVVKNLRGKEGCYTYLDAVRQAITGFKIPGCTKMYVSKDRYIKNADGLWFYSLMIVTKTRNIEVNAEQEPLPIFKTIGFNQHTSEVN